MNSDCEKVRDAIVEVMTGVLPEAEVEEVSAHIEACPACRAYAEALRQEDRLLDRFVSTFDADMGRREEQIITALSRLDEVSSGFGLLRTQIKNALVEHAAAAAVIVVVGLYFVITFSWVSQITAVIRYGL